MADNTTLDPGAGGDTIATDDIGPGVKYQRVKVNFGADGSATDVSSAAPLPVDSELTTVDADTGAGTDTRAGIVLVRAESGGGVLVGSANPLPTNQTAALPAGNNNIGDVDVASLPSIPAGNNNIGDVDIASNAETIADNTGFTDGTSKLAMAGFAFDETAGTALTENDAAAARVDSKRAQVAVIEDETTRGRRTTVTASNALKVDGSAVTQPVSGTVTANLAAGTNNIGDVDVLTLPALPAGTNNIGDVDVLTIAAGTNAIGNVGIIPRTTGGLTTFHLVSAATTNATNVKASAGQVFGWYISNRNSTNFMKVAFHNTAGTPTAGASVFATVDIPPLSAANVFSDIGIAFSTGIAITTVTGAADSDATAVAANDLNINIYYG